MIEATIQDKDILTLFSDPENKEKAFGLLMKKYQERVYWHIRRMVHFHEDADDVIQNVFIKVWQNLENFRGDAQLYTWLYRIATNECLSFIKKRKKRMSFSIDDEDLSLGSRLKADEYFDGDEITIRLQKAIETLPEKQKIVFNLRYYEEMKYDDMSAVLDTSVGALKASYHHAVKKIEHYLKGD
jgi:RNA polymerase sigma-70 factor, ECF subfamily